MKKWDELKPFSTWMLILLIKFYINYQSNIWSIFSQSLWVILFRDQRKKRRSNYSRQHWGIIKFLNEPHNIILQHLPTLFNEMQIKTIRTRLLFPTQSQTSSLISSSEIGANKNLLSSLLSCLNTRPLKIGRSKLVS